MSGSSSQQFSASPRPMSSHDHPLPSSQQESKRKTMGEEVVRRLENLSVHDNDDGETGMERQEQEQKIEKEGVKAHQYEEGEGESNGEEERGDEEHEDMRDRREQQEQESFARDYFQGQIKEAIGEPKSMQVVELIQSVQHELRTPVHGLLSILEGVRRDIYRSPSLTRKPFTQTPPSSSSATGTAPTTASSSRASKMPGSSSAPSASASTSASAPKEMPSAAEMAREGSGNSVAAQHAFRDQQHALRDQHPAAPPTAPSTSSTLAMQSSEKGGTPGSMNSTSTDSFMEGGSVSPTTAAFTGGAQTYFNLATESVSAIAALSPEAEYEVRQLERKSLLTRLDGALGLVERLGQVLEDYKDFSTEVLLSPQFLRSGTPGYPWSPSRPPSDVSSAGSALASSSGKTPAAEVGRSTSGKRRQQQPADGQADASDATPRNARSRSRPQSRGRGEGAESSSARSKEDGGPASPAPVRPKAKRSYGRSYTSRNQELNEAVNFGQMLDEVAGEAWERQVRALRAEDSDARLPPPPELILQIDTSLRTVKSVASIETVKKLAHKLIANSLRFTNEGYVEVSIMPGIDGLDDLSPKPGTAAAVIAAAAQSSDSEDALAEEDKPLVNAKNVRKDLITIVVEDTGEGMTSTFMHEQLFTPFQKADQFKAGAGLSMTLCASLVRKLKGKMHITSDVGRGTVVTVTIPVKHEEQDISPGSEIPPSNVEKLVYLYGFEGLGMQRLAQAISAQLATFGNFYTTTSIEDCDYILLPEEKCIETEGGAEAILAKCKPGIRIGVLQAHEDAGIEHAAWLNRSAPPTFVTRKPFGPKAFEALLGAYHVPPDASREGASGIYGDYFVGASTSKDESGDKGGYDASVGRIEGQQLVGAASAKDDPSGKGEKDGDGDAEKKDLDERTPDTDLTEAAKAGKRGGRGKLPDLLFSPPVIDEILRAPQPHTPFFPRRKASLESTIAEQLAAANASSNGELPLRSSTGDSTASLLSVLSRGVREASPSTPPTFEEEQFCVLVVEDNPLNMRVMAQMLKQSRILQHSAADGLEAVESFKEHLPAVVLLDINMPRMNGFDACVEIRRFEREELGREGSMASRIVAVTALSDDFHRHKGEKCGMDEWICKPVSMKTLKKDLVSWKQQWEERKGKAQAA